MLIIKSQETILIKHLIQGFVMNMKNPATPLLPFLQNECNNISFHPHTQHKRTSRCSGERRRVVFPGNFSKSYSPSPVNGSTEYLMLNTMVRSFTKQPFLRSLTQPLRIGKGEAQRKACFSHPECIPEAKLLFKSHSNKMLSGFHGTLNTPVFILLFPPPRQNDNSIA